MPLLQFLYISSGVSALTSIAICAFYIVTYRIFFHPLAHIPGPLLAKISSLYAWIICYLGIECRVHERWHRQYRSSIIRVSPNSVSISDGAALQPIYVNGGGFSKDARYENFRVEGHATIFSTLDMIYRDSRAKAVLPLFATSRIRAAAERDGVILKCVSQWIKVFQIRKEALASKNNGSSVIDILDMCQRLTVDITTGYLFGKEYGGTKELRDTLTPTRSHLATKKGRGILSIAPFIYSIINLGRFSLLPNWAFHALLVMNIWMGSIWRDPDARDSFRHLHEFVSSLLDTADKRGEDTYQHRLLSIGASESEVIAQCKAVTFAGTDSTATKLVTILFHLVQNQDILRQLEEEQRALDPDMSLDPQMLPLLRAVIREGLRLGMANPARFTRVVPSSGLKINEIFIPPGTIVGIAPYTLHHNPNVYQEPWSFRPYRWLKSKEAKESQSCEVRRRLQDRDFIPFSVGSRACIARNFATQELFLTVREIVNSGLLKGAWTCESHIGLEEWFNLGIKGHSVKIQWP